MLNLFEKAKNFKIVIEIVRFLVKIAQKHRKAVKKILKNSGISSQFSMCKKIVEILWKLIWKSIKKSWFFFMMKNVQILVKNVQKYRKNVEIASKKKFKISWNFFWYFQIFSKCGNFFEISFELFEKAKKFPNFLLMKNIQFLMKFA